MKNIIIITLCLISCAALAFDGTGPLLLETIAPAESAKFGEVSPKAEDVASGPAIFDVSFKIKNQLLVDALVLCEAWLVVNGNAEGERTPVALTKDDGLVATTVRTLTLTDGDKVELWVSNPNGHPISVKAYFWITKK